MKLKIVISLLIFVILGIFTKKFYFNKWIGYESIPNTYIFDEHDYPFVGYSFRKTGVPTGWSILNIYQELFDKKNNTNIGFNGISITKDELEPNLNNVNNYNYPVITTTDVNIGKGTETIKIVQPFLDHPLFGSIIFSLGTRTANTFNDFNPSDYRHISLILSIITGLLLFIFSYILFNNLIISFISFIIYSIVPEYILMSRFSLFENLVIPLSLFSFILILYSIKNNNKNIQALLLFLAGIFSGLSFLTKMSGVYVILVSLIFLINEKTNIKKLLFYIVPIFTLSLLHYGYYYYLSSDLFFKLLFDQASREWFGPLSFFYQIIQPNFSGFPKSGYWLFGIISLFILFIKDQKKYFNLILPFIVYIFVFLFMGGLNYPWYYLPLLPYIIIASAVMIYKIISKPNLASVALFYLLIFCSSFYWGYFVFHQNQNNYLFFRISLFLFLILFIIKKYKITKYSNILWSLFFIIVLFQIYQWNNQGFLYIISNWNKLPTNFSFPI